jgi:DNA replication ATP-dependent helicase Dna2
MHAAYNQALSLLAVPKLLEVEEDIWLPRYGFKDKLDILVHTIILDPKLLSLQPNVTEGPNPFEIKTGWMVGVMEHCAQTMLYTLLTAKWYGVKVPAGLLYYMQSEEVVRVPVSWNEMAGYMMQRYPVPKWGDGDIDVEDLSVPWAFVTHH